MGKIACRSRRIFADKGRDFAHAVDAGSDRVGNGKEAIAYPPPSRGQALQLRQFHRNPL